jgi:hypothetical protein
MSDIRFNRWLHQSGTGGVSQDGLGKVGIGTTVPLYTLDVRGDISFTGTLYQNGGEFVTSRWRTDSVGVSTQKSVGINTSGVNTPSLTGIGNSFQGLYVANGMVIMDNAINGNHYIGTAYNGLMAGPVIINGILSVDGNYVVV